MYITKDTGNIYVDISNTERIQLNADAATRIRTSNTDDSVDLTYADIQSLFNKKLNTTNPSVSGYMTIDRAKLLTDGDTNTLYLNSTNGTGNYQGAIATQNYVNTEIAKIPTILSGTTEPDDSIGDIGDIYIQLAEEG